MKKIYESRASLLLYNFILSHECFKSVLLPANICPIVPAVFLKAGTEIHFFDIEKKHFQMDKQKLTNLIKRNKKKYSGILWMNGYGSEENNENYFKSLKNINKNLLIIDDRCLQKPKTKFKSSTADLILFSTGYSKYVDLGSGGYGFIQKNFNYKRSNLNYIKNDYNQLIRKFNQSINKKITLEYNIHNWLGEESKIIKNENNYNNRIKNKILQSNKHKQAINEIYNKILFNKCKLPNKFNNWRYNIIVNKKDLLLKEIFKNGLFASSHYYPSSFIFGSKKSFNGAEFVSNVIVNLFNDFRYSKRQALKTCKIVNDHVEKYGVPKLK